MCVFTLTLLLCSNHVPLGTSLHHCSAGVEPTPRLRDAWSRATVMGFCQRTHWHVVHYRGIIQNSPLHLTNDRYQEQTVVAVKMCPGNGTAEFWQMYGFYIKQKLNEIVVRSRNLAVKAGFPRMPNEKCAMRTLAEISFISAGETLHSVIFKWLHKAWLKNELLWTFNPRRHVLCSGAWRRWSPAPPPRHVFNLSFSVCTAELLQLQIRSLQKAWVCAGHLLRRRF